jgi:two-component system, OmpR family, phosphate regulon sensor histidine kinase PhoR
MFTSVRRRLTWISVAVFATAAFALAWLIASLQGSFVAEHLAPHLPAGELAAVWRRTLLVIYGAAAAATLLASLVMARLLGAALRPLEGLTEAAQEMSAGNLESRLPEGEDEWGRLGATLNEMARSLSGKLAELAESRDRLMTVLAHMANGVMLVDSTGRLLLANNAARQMARLHESDLGRNHVAALRHFDLSSAITRALATGQEGRGEMHLHDRPIEAVLAPVQGGGAVVVLLDIRERERLGQMRRDFVANVSHELKTPVTSIQGFAETLLAGALEDPAAARPFVAIIHRETLRINRLVNDLLELARLEGEPQAIRPVPTAVQPLLETVAARMSPLAEAQEVLLRAEAEPVTAEVDPALLEQLLVNLIDNSLKHTPTGGRIEVRLHADGAHLVGTVADTGAGIPAAALPRIFERFYRVDSGRARKAGGTGLGLAIVKHIAEAHGGHVAATSTVGQGTTISFSMPLSKQ